MVVGQLVALFHSHISIEVLKKSCECCWNCFKFSSSFTHWQHWMIVLDKGLSIRILGNEVCIFLIHTEWKFLVCQMISAHRKFYMSSGVVVYVCSNFESIWYTSSISVNLYPDSTSKDLFLLYRKMQNSCISRFIQQYILNWVLFVWLKLWVFSTSTWACSSHNF